MGTLTVDNDTLPPRKNKKKIAWRLPDDPNALPKFGEKERKRLWELFKEQKKERRRQSKKMSSFDDKSEGGSSNKSVEPNEPAPPTPTANTTPDHSVVEGTEGPDDYGGAGAGGMHKKKESHKERTDENAVPFTSNYSSTAPPPPPPGFDLKKLSISNQPQEENSIRRTSPTPGPENNRSPRMSNGSAAAPNHNNVPANPTTAPPPPPPGLAPTAGDMSIPPQLYFELADDQPLAALGGLVAPLFLECVTTSTVIPWLARSHPTLSQTTLLLGSAQATGRTYIDRLQQWQSLTISNSWDCTGLTSQTLPMPNTVLLVLTGRTIQKHECLAYHLSLVLTAAMGTRNFQITNEILSLTTLSNVPVVPT